MVRPDAATARAHLDAGHSDVAVDLALTAIAAGDANGDALAVCAEAMLRKRLDPEAFHYADRLVAAHPERAGGHAVRGWVHHLLGRDAPAADDLRRAAELAPEVATTHYRLGRVLVYGAQVDRAGALRCFTRALELAPDHVEAQRERGLVALAEGERAAAEADLRAAAAAGDAYAGYCLDHHGFGVRTAAETWALGRDRWLRNQRDASIRLFKDALAAGFEDPARTTAVELELADNLRAVRADDEADAVYSRVIEREPGDATAHARRAWHRYNLSRDAEAEADYQRAIALDPQQPQHAARLGTLYAVTERFADGIAVVDAVLADHPDTPDALFARGLCRAGLGDDDGAMADLRRAEYLGHRSASDHRRKRWGDTDPLDWFATGCDALDAGDHARAIAAFTEAAARCESASRHPGDHAWRYRVKAMHNRAYARYLAGIAGDPVAELERVVDLAPYYLDAWVTLGNVHMSTPDHAAASEAYTRAIELSRADGRGFYGRGRCRLAAGDHAGAVADLDEAVRLYDRPQWKADALFHRGEAHEAAGDLEAALADFEAAFNTGQRMTHAIQRAFAIRDRLGR